LVFLTWGSAEELRERGDSDMMRWLRESTFVSEVRWWHGCP
jgi:hypothetical protein